MKIYVVGGFTPYEGSETIALFLSEDKAKQYIKDGHAAYGRNWESYYVESMPVLDAPDTEH